MSEALAPVLERIDADFDDAVERLKDFLRLKSVGTDPAHDADTRAAAQWCADRLSELGFEATVHDTPGQPIVVAHHDGPGGADGPRLLYYGHYDVQPPDPIELWESDPFEPAIVDAEHGKRIVARGANDDKGQVSTILEAFRAWVAVHGTLPVKITILLEG
ncbi:MAG: M20/M25/M40 family metallo-hydrolase, partial [Planctomycetota bacterium]|nr:M20/M25/M40 family metallo-hydrolase [Planctomycetota bacterium]